MATIATFAIPAADFPLGRIFDDLPKTTVEIERVVPTTQDALPYFWVDNSQTVDLQALLTADPAFESVTCIDALETRSLYRAVWNMAVEGVVTGILESELTLLSAVGTHERWRFEFRAEKSDQLTAFYEYCTDRDITVRLDRLQSTPEPDENTQYGLTSDQREALLLAVSEGYYEQPRETDLETLASLLDISRSSFADRLRRGYRNLLEHTIVTAPAVTGGETDAGDT